MVTSTHLLNTSLAVGTEFDVVIACPIIQQSIPLKTAWRALVPGLLAIKAVDMATGVAR
jgi:hypothetical protein